MKTKDPRGQTWRVTRRWVPWRRRTRSWLDHAPDFPALGDDPISAVIAIILLILMIPFLLLAFVVALEFLLLLLLIPLVALVRVLFGGKWIVEVRRGWRPHWEAKSGSWSESGHHIRSIVDAIAHGEPPPGNIARE